MSSESLLRFVAEVRVGLAETRSRLPNSSDPDAVTSLRDVDDAFAWLGEVRRGLLGALKASHVVSERLVDQPDGDAERFVSCSCGWLELLDHDWTGTYATLGEARAAHLADPHLPGILEDNPEPYLTGELAEMAVWAEENRDVLRWL